MARTALNEAVHRLRVAALKRDGGGLGDGELLECYIVERDEAAFEAIVRRHGPMVFGVCRRILQNDADAEDAFQATFLVLVRKANTIRPRGMVSNWLYGVAHNTALKAKAMIHKRRMKETEAGTMPKRESAKETWTLVQGVVDAELSRLPDKYRVPIILCDLEGKTIKEATHHLGWPQGTVASRLTRGRALLAKRLTKHGVVLSAGLLAGALMQGAASASVPAALTASTVQAAGLYAAGKAAAASGVSATALALTDGMLKTMLLGKLKLAASAVVVVAMLTAGIGGVAYRMTGSEAGDDQRPAQTVAACSAPEAKPMVPPPKENPEGTAPAAQPAKPDEPEPCITPPPVKKPTVRTFKIQTVVIHQGIDLATLEAHLKKFFDAKIFDKATPMAPPGAIMMLRRSGSGSPPGKIEIHKFAKGEAAMIIAALKNQKPGCWTLSPEGKYLCVAVWPDGQWKQSGQTVTIVSKATMPGGGQAPPGGATLHALPADGLWIVLPDGRFQQIHPTPVRPVPLNVEALGVYSGTYPLAP